MERILILSGSKSDDDVAKQVIDVLNVFGISYRYEVASAHRNPEKVDSLVKETTANVFVAIAGLSAALPGVVAARTTKPVIGVPATSANSAAGGLDSILSITQMPPNVPVACVGLNMGKNAGVLAIQILALTDSSLAGKLSEFKEKLKQ